MHCSTLIEVFWAHLFDKIEFLKIARTLFMRKVTKIEEKKL